MPTATTQPTHSASKRGARCRIGDRGQRAIAHVQAAIDKRRAERNERLAALMAQRLADIQNAEAQRQRKGGR